MIDLENWRKRFIFADVLWQMSVVQLAGGCMAEDSMT